MASKKNRGNQQRAAKKTSRRKARQTRREQDTLILPPAGFDNGLLPPDTAAGVGGDDTPFDPQLHEILIGRGWVLEHQDNDADAYTWTPSWPTDVGVDADAMPTGINVANPTPATLDEIRAGLRSGRPGAAYQVEYAGIGDAYIGSPDFPVRDYPDRDQLLADIDSIETHRAAQPGSA
ncbi:hypothetical protein IUS38_24755 [Mycobacteroides abscessus subsp. abscessus]|uniref:hypothetical protein n=1 Tax=Mycobacteroides abscessus TaxID=36809 RepID=UPI0019D0D8BD|nr:hypothetical protein [Mycobacteroides abscessus]MBN7438796.1 hypothetical protein [Mycobacteroides abscessus subsp. abscessus]